MNCTQIIFDYLIDGCELDTMSLIYKELILTMGYAGQGDTLPTYDKMYGLL